MSEDEEPSEEQAIGPKCDVCGQSTNSLYPILVKRERRGMYEMIQIYLCAIHFCERMEQDALPPPPDEEESIAEKWKEFMDEINPPDDEDDDDENEGTSSTIDHQGQSFG
jgi:hypothetical protein